MSDVQIEYTRLAEIEGAPRNAKEHDQGAIQASIGRFGFTSPVLVDERTGKLVAGHGRLEALRQMQYTGQEPPERIEKNGSDWLVPVIRGVGFRSDVDAEAYLVADNRLTDLGGWDEPALADVLKDLAEADALEGVGYDADDVEAMISELGREENTNDPDDVPEPPEEPVTKRGDVWLLGRHRVMCGDSTVQTDVDVLMDGEHPDVLVIDPPYGMNLDTAFSKRPLTAKARGKHPVQRDYPAVIGDDESFDPSDIFNMFADVSEQFWWGADYYHHKLPQGGSWLVWDKRASVEEVKYSSAEFELLWSMKSHARRILRVPWFGLIGTESQDTSKRVHPTQKPLGVYEPLLTDHCSDQGLVLDLFGGSGSTLIAAEKTGRRAFVMELAEQYADVICRRYQEYAGVLPVLESTGEAHDFTAQPEQLQKASG